MIAPRVRRAIWIAFVVVLEIAFIAAAGWWFQWMCEGQVGC